MPVVQDGTVDLLAPVACVDTDSMLNAEAEILALDGDARALLQAYRELGLAARADRNRAAAEQAAAAETTSDEGTDRPDEAEPTDSEGAEQARTVPFEIEKSDPWVPRVNDLAEVDTTRLPELHGKLIAAGFLTFQIRDRTTGVEYRVANAGKQFLSRQAEPDDSDSTESQLPADPTTSVDTDASESAA